MLHGDLVTLTAKGVLLSEKAAETIGVYDNSVCWGVWYQNPIQKPTDQGYREKLIGHRHLIVSPFHPRSWPFLLRVEVCVRDEPGALARVCSALNESGLSLVLIECTPSGFSHATFNLICEYVGMPEKHKWRRKLESLRAGKEAIDKKFRCTRVEPRHDDDAAPVSAREYGAIRSLFTKTAARMIAVEEDVRAELRARLKHDLYSWRAHNDLLVDATDFDRRVDRILRAHGAKRASSDVRDQLLFEKLEVTWISPLAVFAFYGGGRYAPIPFRYRRDQSFLFVAEPAKLDGDDHRLRGLPLPALASFNQGFKYLRLDPMSSERLTHHPTRIDLEYRLESFGDAKHHGIGLLHKLAQTLRDNDVDVLHVVNKWTDYRYDTEAGRIAFIADVDRAQHERIKCDLSKAPERLRARADPAAEDRDGRDTSGSDRAHITKVQVADYSVRRLFLSMHFGHPREQQMKQALASAAEARGFRLEVVQTAGENVPERIEREIGAADAVVQVLCFRADEDPETVSLPWLDYEFGLARGLRAPVVRLVDVVRKPLSWWEQRIRIHRDLHLKAFRSDVSDGELEKQFEDALAILGRLLAERGR
ncbi:MAG: ACT domain-containing protein [Planctomycetota bacterium]